MFLVKCALMISLSGSTYQGGQFLGTLLEKQSADFYLVDFEIALKQRFGAKDKAPLPYVKRVPSNNCLFVGGPYGKAD